MMHHVKSPGRNDGKAIAILIAGIVGIGLVVCVFMIIRSSQSSLVGHPDLVAATNTVGIVPTTQPIPDSTNDLGWTATDLQDRWGTQDGWRWKIEPNKKFIGLSNGIAHHDPENGISIVIQTQNDRLMEFVAFISLGQTIDDLGGARRLGQALQMVCEVSHWDFDKAVNWVMGCKKSYTPDTASFEINYNSRKITLGFIDHGPEKGVTALLGVSKP